MRYIAILTIVYFLYTVSMVSAMTNREFLDFIDEYATDVEVQDHANYEFTRDFDSNDVIDLSRNLDDEVDLEPAIASLFNDLNSQADDSELSDLTSRANDLRGVSCSRDSCKMCGSRRFSARFFFKTISYTLKPCVATSISRSDLEASITVTLSGRRVYRKTISLRNPPGMCFGVPKLRTFARVCLKLYDIEYKRRKFCMKTEGIIDLKLKKFKATLKLGCVTIPSSG